MPLGRPRSGRGSTLRDRHMSMIPKRRRRARASLAGLPVGPVMVVVAGLALPVTARGQAPELHVRVFATHDFHGALRPTTYSWSDGRPVGGATGLERVIEEAGVECSCPTLWVDGGDQMQGTLESNLAWGLPVVEAFNLLGLDAAAVGNHDLDWGVDTLLARQREADYPWLAANVFRLDTGERPAWATPFAIVEREGVKVGVVGYATVGTPRTLRPQVTEPFEFRSGYAGIRDALDAVWAERPDFVVVVAHAGGDCNAGGCAGEMVALASEVPPGSVHLIAGGHTHDPGGGVVNSIPIVRAGSSGRGVAVVDLYRLADGTRAFLTSRQTVYADGIVEDTALVALLEPYMASADEKRNQHVTTLAQSLRNSATEDRRLGDLIADSERRIAAADFGLQNPGGVRAELPAGPVSYADLHRVLPFGNMLVRVTLSGRQLRRLVEQTGPRYYYSKLQVDYAVLAGGARSASIRFSDGSPIDDDRQYTVAMPDFLAEGGDDLSMLTGLPREAMGMTVLDAVVERMRELPNPLVLPTERRELDRTRR